MRKAFIVFVDLDPVEGGAFDSADSALVNIHAILDQQIGWYNPTVSLAPLGFVGERTRPGFIVYVDLDQTPGHMYSQESAQNVIRAILYNRIAHYRPTVSLAVADLQPVNEGNN
jgi:hypothetical protein